MLRTRRSLTLGTGALLLATGLSVTTVAPAAAAAAGAVTPSAVTQAPVTQAAVTQAPVRVVAGPSPVTDSRGDTWSAATGFVGGITNTAPYTVVQGDDVIPAADKPLYQYVRQNPRSWSSPVANGKYRVELDLLDPDNATARQRVFDVTSEGAVALKNVDIAHDVTRNAADKRIFLTTVKDGVLNLDFVAQRGRPAVAAIRVDLVPTGPAGKPSAANTGVPAGTTLTRPTVPASGVLLLDVAGKTYTGLDIRGRLRILAPGITLQNSIVRGNDSTSLGSVIDVNYPGYDHTGFRLVDSTIAPTYAHFEQDGILGHDFTVLRSEITGTTDAVKITGDNVTVQDSYLHDARYFYGIGGSTNDTHNDGVQATQGQNIVIDHNTITGNGNAGMQLVQDSGPIRNVSFTDNWVDDGGCSVNFGSRNSVDGANYGLITGDVSNNVFWRHQKNKGCAVIRSASKSALTVSGNTWVDPVGPVTPTNGS